QVAARFLPVAGIDEIVPVGDLVVDRAAGVAIGDAAIHAARRLVARAVLRQRDDEFAIVANAVGSRPVAPFLPVDLQETCDLSHMLLLSRFPIRQRRTGSAPAPFPSARGDIPPA